ncbi:cobalt-precorrin-4/precorrin-4 C(11)-methyltransferase [uncultured Desulfovibrio sp.]|uniref:cobalt-precorrin-4/precorrin-4 C(11)-methyltransferase n=1 Tax=uncultured Desulfovibrio sp. TaxID=167968 RepID=UPI0026122863|nr:cobalt-precorrin-4/precorrin-4 C(11)-methyltransferase [uncultured Desulfovibrio sp.]
MQDTQTTPPHAATGLVSFVGAGPGDPELLTIKGRKAIEDAGLVLYAGSLVPPGVVACARPDALVADSAPLTLEQCHALVRDAALAGRNVARVHTGDPSLYGALREQAQLLDRDGIPWRVIAFIMAVSNCASPLGQAVYGVLFEGCPAWAVLLGAAAAAAGVTFTVPEATQSLIISRLEGRTPVPEQERLAALAAHKTSLAVYLSAQSAPLLQAELARSLPPETPVLCAHRAGWPNQQLHWTSLGNLARCVEEHGITSQTVFLILPGQLKKGAASRLYAANFSHGRRKGGQES